VCLLLLASPALRARAYTDLTNAPVSLIPTHFQDAAVAKAGAAAAAVTALVTAAAPAVAATEVATLAAGDGRLAILLGLFVPALGWVAFNMAQV